MIPWALVFAADIAAGLALEAKNLRRKEILGDYVVLDFYDITTQQLKYGTVAVLL